MSFILSDYFTKWNDKMKFDCNSIFCNQFVNKREVRYDDVFATFFEPKTPRDKDWDLGDLNEMNIRFICFNRTDPEYNDWRTTKEYESSDYGNIIWDRNVLKTAKSFWEIKSGIIQEERTNVEIDVTVKTEETLLFVRFFQKKNDPDRINVFVNLTSIQTGVYKEMTYESLDYDFVIEFFKVVHAISVNPSQSVCNYDGTEKNKGDILKLHSLSVQECIDNLIKGKRLYRHISEYKRRVIYQGVEDCLHEACLQENYGVFKKCVDWVIKRYSKIVIEDESWSSDSNNLELKTKFIKNKILSGDLRGVSKRLPNWNSKRFLVDMYFLNKICGFRVNSAVDKKIPVTKNLCDLINQVRIENGNKKSLMILVNRNSDKGEEKGEKEWEGNGKKEKKKKKEEKSEEHRLDILNEKMYKSLSGVKNIIDKLNEAISSLGNNPNFSQKEIKSKISTLNLLKRFFSERFKFISGFDGWGIWDSDIKRSLNLASLEIFEEDKEEKMLKGFGKKYKLNKKIKMFDIFDIIEENEGIKIGYNADNKGSILGKGKDNNNRSIKDKRKDILLSGGLKVDVELIKDSQDNLLKQYQGTNGSEWKHVLIREKLIRENNVNFIGNDSVENKERIKNERLNLIKSYKNNLYKKFIFEIVKESDNVLQREIVKNKREVLNLLKIDEWELSKSTISGEKIFSKIKEGNFSLEEKNRFEVFVKNKSNKNKLDEIYNNNLSEIKELEEEISMKYLEDKISKYKKKTLNSAIQEEKERREEEKEGKNKSKKKKKDGRYKGKSKEDKKEKVGKEEEENLNLNLNLKENKGDGELPKSKFKILKGKNKYFNEKKISKISNSSKRMIKSLTVIDKNKFQEIADKIELELRTSVKSEIIGLIENLDNFKPMFIFKNDFVNLREAEFTPPQNCNLETLLLYKAYSKLPKVKNESVNLGKSNKQKQKQKSCVIIDLDEQREERLKRQEIKKREKLNRDKINMFWDLGIYPS